ncbi:(4Fe-4S)-binding protein [Altibacter sp. HG106]|uniref:(4Fe-4S)-binding protein n=1 Tax=Altibacter sp. HG106 TaxID=3023937 RepID=UPI002350DF4B|nr:(4Fe-4S)-binding protein [Altibacter sp. HG106]MDC7993707.1 (4Fe-4S)-binding protein [Altibacter sp. HG106]
MSTPNTYSNGEITVAYNPKKCTHSECCAQELSEVFRTAVIPWIHLDAASSERIAQQVARCPSGALSCTRIGSCVAVK